jgi:hypothetical protein
MAAGPLAFRVAAAAALVAAAALPVGPLAFLPPTLRWPLVLAAGALALRPGPRAERAAEGLAVCAVLATYALLKVPGLHASWTDDNVYFHMGVRVAAGEVPYRDFFFAHPPLHLAPPALAFRLAGFSIPLAKALPALAQGLAGFLLWRAARRASRVLAVAALALHLTAYQVLMASADLDGANLATAWVMAALLAATAARPLLAGALAGLGVGTVLYAAAGAGAIGVACALRGRRAAARFTVGLAASLAPVFGASLAVGGGAFAQAVFGYHAAKVPAAGRAAVLGEGPAGAVSGWLHNLAADALGPGALRSFAFHAPLHVAAGLGATALAASLVRRRRDGRPAPERAPADDLALVAVAGVLLSVAQGAVLPDAYAFYGVPAIPWLALLGAYGAWHAARALRAPGRARAWAAAGLAAFALHPLLRGAADRAAFPEEAQRAGERVTYAWRDPDALAGAARISRALLWKDHRVRGAPEPPWRHALWNKQHAFSTAGEIAAHVRAGSAADETLVGGSMVAPLVALLAERRLAAGEVDTNEKRFATGSLEDGDLLRRALGDRVRFVLASPRSHFTEALLERDPRWSARFVRDRVFLDRALSRAGPVRLVLYRRRDAEAPVAPDASRAPP